LFNELQKYKLKSNKKGCQEIDSLFSYREISFSTPLLCSWPINKPSNWSNFGTCQENYKFKNKSYKSSYYQLL